MRNLAIVGACAVTLAVSSTPAFAEDAPPKAPAGDLGRSADAAPDVVQLKNGGMVRGTIAELAPGKQVTIVLVTGGQRTISMDEVKYAGPAADAPRSATPPPPAEQTNAPTDGGLRPLVTIHAPEARLSLRAAEPDVTFFVRTGVAAGPRGFTVTAYERICTAPCDASLPSGTYDMALSSKNGAPRRAKEPVVLNGPATVQGEFESRAGVRTLGAVIMVAGGIGGIALAASAFSSHEECSGSTGSYSSSFCYTKHEVNAEQAMVGSVLAGGSITAGLLMLILVKDKAVITVIPGSPAASNLRLGQDVRSSARLAAGLAGLSLHAAF